MTRRSLRLAISALVLLALLLSARVSAPAALAAPSSGKIHVVLVAAGGNPVLADINEPVALLAHANHLAAGDRIIISEVGVSHRVTVCNVGEDPCAGTDDGGEAGTFHFKAGVINAKGKVVAKSNGVGIVRRALSLTLGVSDQAGTLKDGSQLSGVNTTFTLDAPAGAASSWKTIGIYLQSPPLHPDWLLIGTPCTPAPNAFSCPRTYSDDYNPLNDSDAKVMYEAQAKDANGAVVAASAPLTVNWRRWLLDITVSGKQVTNQRPPQVVQLGRHDQVTVEVTTSIQTLQLADQQFHITILSSGRTNTQCTTLPCTYTGNAPSDNCGDCTDSFSAYVEGGSSSSSPEAGTQYGETLFDVRWHTSGYQFSGMTLDYTWNRSFNTTCNPGKDPNCKWPGPDVSVTSTISGYVCGDPYKDPWTISTDIATTVPGSPTAHFPLHGLYTFDPDTELASPQKEFADAVAEAPEHIAQPYVNLHLHGTADPSTGAKTPNQAELTMDVPPDVTAPHIITVPGTSEQEWVRLGVPSGPSTAMVTTKGDCP